MKALAVLLVLLVGLGIGLDRVAVGMAENRVAAEVARQGELRGAPAVDIGGFPFLTQAVTGRYDDVRVSLTAAELGQPDGTRADLRLRGVHAPLAEVLSGAATRVPVDRIDGTATLSYGLLARELGDGTTLRREGDAVRVTRTVELLGRELRLTATGGISLDGSDLVVDVQEASGVGVDVPGWLLDRADGLLDLRHPVPALPFGLQVTSVVPAADGVDVGLRGTDTVLGG